MSSKYWAVFKMSFKETLKNYKLLIGLSIFMITCLLIFAHIWQVAEKKVGAEALSPILLLWYITFNEWILIAVPSIEMDIENELKTGQLAYYLPRPISYLGFKMAEGLGALCVNMIFLGLSGFLFTYLWTDILPFTLDVLFIYVLLAVLAGILSLIFTMIVGMAAFFVNEVEPWRWIFEKLLFLFGGLMLPLTVYPLWMQKVAAWTPFPVILGGRSGLLFNPDKTAIIGMFLLSFLWITIALLALYALYKKGLKALNIQGG